MKVINISKGETIFFPESHHEAVLILATFFAKCPGFKFQITKKIM